MFYHPKDSRFGLWDTWLLQQGDEYHLFYLQRERHQIGCYSIEHIFSRDWRHWQALPTVLSASQGSAWDSGALMTGMVVPHEGRYYQFYGSMVDRVQRIGVAISDDLIHWEKYSHNPILEARSQWYEDDPLQALNYEVAWRDPYIFYHAPDHCYYAFICARVKNAAQEWGGGCVAVARSTDLLHWEHLPPAYVSETITCLEVPEYFELAGRHYVTYTTSYHFGTPYPTRKPHQATGSFYVVSDQMLGGYAIPPSSDVLFASLPQSVTAYVGRSIPAATPDKRLFYYQNVYPIKIGESVLGSLSAPKWLEADSEGLLQARYASDWFKGLPSHDLAAPTPEQAYTLHSDPVSAGCLEAQVNAFYCGLILQAHYGREGVLEALAIWLAPASEGRLAVLLGGAFFESGPNGARAALSSPVALAELTSAWHPGPGHHVRVMFQEACVDVYVDDVLYLSHTYDPEQWLAIGQVGAFYAGKPKVDALTQVKCQTFGSF